MAKRGKRLPNGCVLIRQGGRYITLDPHGTIIRSTPVKPR
jgi:hypothetical protein